MSLPSSPPPGLSNDLPRAFSAELVAEICTIIRTDGVSDLRAGLLAGANSLAVQQWKGSEPRFAERLQRARAEFQRERLARIREAAARDGTVDWRAQVWLAEHAGTGTGIAEDQAEIAPPQPTESPFAMTPEQLASLQERRAIALSKMKR